MENAEETTDNLAPKDSCIQPARTGQEDAQAFPGTISHLADEQSIPTEESETNTGARGAQPGTGAPAVAPAADSAPAPGTAHATGTAYAPDPATTTAPDPATTTAHDPATPAARPAAVGAAAVGLQKRLAQLEARLAVAENRALIRTFAALTATRGSAALTGELDLPLLALDDVTLSFELFSDERNQAGPLLIELPVRKLPPVHDDTTLQWSVAFDWARLSAQGAPQLGDCYHGRLIVQRLGLKAELEVLVRAQDSDATLVFDPVLGKDNAFKAGEAAGEPLFTVTDCHALRDVVLSYEVESLAWEDQELVAQLVLSHPLADSNILNVSVGLELAGATEDAGPLPIAVAPSFAGHGRRRIGFRFVPEDLIPAAVPAEARLRYVLALAYRCGSETVGHRLDLFMKNPSIDANALEQHQLISKNRFIKPVAAGGLALGFEVETVVHGLSEPMVLHVADLEWTEGTLGMNGTVSQRLQGLKGFAVHLMLLHGDGEKRYIPWTVAVPDDPAQREHRNWSVRFRASALLGGLKAGTWQFAVEKRFGPLSAVEPFALKRHDGLGVKFGAKMIRTGNDYWLPVDIGNGVIGFRTVDSAAVSETAVPRITHLEWTGDQKLSLSGTARHPLTNVGGLQCSLMLQSVSAGSIEIPMRSAVRADGTIAWQAEFSPSQLLSDKGDSLWYLTFAKRFDRRFDSEILVNESGSEDSARLDAQKLAGGVTVRQGTGGSIGFKVAPMPVEQPPQRRRRRFFRR